MAHANDSAFGVRRALFRAGGRPRSSLRRSAFGILLAAGMLAGCRQDMHDTPRFEAYEKNDFFADKRAMRPLVEGTVARGMLHDNDAFYTGRQDGQIAIVLPANVTVDAALLDRGQTRFNVYCAPCHSPLGDGNGMVVQRGYKKPTSFHDPRLRNERIGYFFDVMTNGFGQMPDYKAQIAPQDRWAIAVYMRALQLSQGATVDDVPADRHGELDGKAGEGRPRGAAPTSDSGGAEHD